MSRTVGLALAVVTSAVSVAPAPAAAAPAVQRLGGNDRYETAVAVSRSAFPSGVPAVVVATGESFPDALAGGPAAAAAGGPVLLVRRDDVPVVTAAELRRLAPARVAVLGGPAAVSDAVVAELRAFAPQGVTRVAGADRYGTAAAVSARWFPAGAAFAFVATGATFADAVAAGAFGAGPVGGPVLLVARTSVPGATAGELRRLRPQAILVVGGPAAVAADVERQLAGFSAQVARVTGPDRYATAAALSRALHPTGAPAVALAAGRDFPDALAAGPVAAGARASLLLSTPSCLPAPTARELARLAPGRVLLAGGTASLGPAVEQLTPCAPPATPAQLARDLLDRANDERRARGLAAYAWDDGLAAVAQEGADRLATPSTTQVLADPRAACCDVVAAHGSFLNTFTSGDTHQVLMALEAGGGDRRSLLQPGYQVAGVGVRCNAQTGALAVVEYYGRRKGSGTPVVSGRPPVGAPVRTDAGVACP